MVDVLDLRDKVGQVRLERLRVVVVQDAEIDPMTPAQEEGGSVPVTVKREMRKRQLIVWLQTKRARRTCRDAIARPAARVVAGRSSRDCLAASAEPMSSSSARR